MLVSCGLVGDGQVVSVRGGDPERGAELIASFGCGSCHIIPGIEAADGVVGPPLTDVGRRRFIDPQAIEPGTAMPNLGLSEEQARHVAAYLFTLL
jgi:cytochrome c